MSIILRVALHFYFLGLMLVINLVTSMVPMCFGYSIISQIGHNFYSCLFNFVLIVYLSFEFVKFFGILLILILINFVFDILLFLLFWLHNLYIRLLNLKKLFLIIYCYTQTQKYPVTKWLLKKFIFENLLLCSNSFYANIPYVLKKIYF